MSADHRSTARAILGLALTILLAGSAAAGVNQWTVVGPPIRVRALGVDPHNPDNLYAAGDEMAATSHDRGATWTLSPTPGLHAASAVRVAVSMPSTIYALGSTELYRS